METTIKVKINSELKRKVMSIFKSLSLNMNDAINIFLAECVVRGKLPFDVYIPKYNKKTINAMRESERLGKSKTAKRYRTIDELFKDLLC